MKTIAFINNKGGVGKTASVTTIAHMMYALHHKKVLIVDMDPQSNTSAMYTNTEWLNIFLSTLPDEYCAISPEMKKEYAMQKDLSIEDLLIDSELDPHTVIRHTQYDGIDIIMAHLTLSETERRMKEDIIVPQQFKLEEQLNKVKDEYDYCLIDCSPSISILNINALVAADEVYMPLRCDGNSAIGCAISLDLIRMVRRYRPDIKVDGIFFTQYDPRMKVAQTIDELLHTFLTNVEVLPFKVGKTKYLEENTYQQIPLLEADSGKNKCSATKAYMQITEYILAPNKKKFLKDLREKELL